MDNQKLLAALLLAVNEAQDWHDECRGNRGRLKELAPCFEILDSAGLKIDDEMPVFQPKG